MGAPTIPAACDTEDEVDHDSTSSVDDEKESDVVDSSRSASPSSETHETDFSNVSESDESDMDPDFINFSYSIYEARHQNIYKNSDLSVLASSLLLMSLFIATKMNHRVMDFFIIVLRHHLPIDNKVIKSVYLLKKFFAQSNFSKYEHFYCNLCHKFLSNATTECLECKSTSKKTNKFTTYDICQQIENFFKRPNFASILKRRHETQRPESESMSLENITHGELYKKFSSIFKGMYDLSLFIYTDGVNMFNSCKLHCYPIFFGINELPFKIRFLPKNLIFGGLWWSHDKPDFNLFLWPIVEQLKKLSEPGIEIFQPALGVVKVGLIALTADKPAKADVLNMRGHTGRHSCVKCEIRGGSVPVPGKTRGKFVFAQTKPAKLRNSEEAKRQGREAQSKGAIVKGFKGPNSYSYCVIDFINGIAEDVMHGVYGGAGGKKTIELGIHVNFEKEPFSFHSKLNIINERISKVKPPNFIKRRLRTFKDIHHYKTSEYKNWFLYYSLPILCDLLEEKYFVHYFKLVQAIFLLNADVVTLAAISKAEELLKEYVIDFKKYYYAHNMTPNTHSLLHLAEMARQLGPLYELSCFPLESILGILKKYVLGPNSPPVKIHAAFNIIQNLPIYQELLAKFDPASKSIIDKLSHGQKKMEQIGENIFQLGALAEVKEFSNFLQTSLGEYLFDIPEHSNVSKLWTFYRFQNKTCTVTAESYSRSKLYNSSLVRTKTGNIFKVVIFAKYKTCECLAACMNCKSHYRALGYEAIILRHEKIPQNDFMGEICFRTTPTSINVDEIDDLCCHIVVDSKQYYVKRLNSKENE